jgi:hypothetical protein
VYESLITQIKLGGLNMKINVEMSVQEFNDYQRYLSDSRIEKAKDSILFKSLMKVIGNCEDQIEENENATIVQIATTIKRELLSILEKVS